MTPIEALPCPFCGHVGLDFYDGSTFRWLGYCCAGCGVGSETRTQPLGPGTASERRTRAEQVAITEWNTRVQPASEPLTQAMLCSPFTQAMLSPAQPASGPVQVATEDQGATCTGAKP